MTDHFFGKKGFALCVMITSAVAVFSGCNVEPTPAERPGDPEAPILTPQDLAAGVLQDAQLDGPIPRPGSKMAKGVKKNILDLLRREKVELAGTPAGDAAIEIIKTRIDERVFAYERAELWEHVVTYAEAHEIFSSNSKKFLLTMKRAEIELLKPVVTVTGLPVFDGHKLAMLKVYIPKTSKTHLEQMAIGEEKHGIRVIEVYGDDLGIRYEYLETGQLFIAYLPGAK